jgi:hypothetical protein
MVKIILKYHSGEVTAMHMRGTYLMNPIKSQATNPTVSL